MNPAPKPQKKLLVYVLLFFNFINIKFIFYLITLNTLCFKNSKVLNLTANNGILNATIDVNPR